MRDEIFLTERIALPDGRTLFDRYDKILGRHTYTVWDPEEGREMVVPAWRARMLRAEAVES